MKNFLKVVMHLCFVAFAVTLFSLIIFDSYEYDTVRGTFASGFSLEDTDSTFEESVAFNQQLGSSISDVISYCVLMDEIDDNETNETNESVSGNTLYFGQDDSNGFYKEHGKYKDYFNAENSNVRFFIIEKCGKDVVTRTNIPGAGVKSTENDLKTMLLENCNKYIYLNGLNHIYESNTLIEEETLYRLFDNASYEFPLDTTIMVGVNKDLTSIEDNFTIGNKVYNCVGKNFVLRLILLAVSGFIYFVCLIILSVVDGVSFDKESGKRLIKLSSLDKIPCGIRLVLIAAFGLCFIGVLSYINEFKPILQEMYFTNSIGLMILVAVVALICSIIISYFILGFFRRLRAKIIWKTSFSKKIFDACSKLADHIYDNSSSIIKVAIPFAVLCIFNIFFTIMAVMTELYFIIIIILIFDAFDGYGIYKNYLDKEEIIGVINKICQGDMKAKAKDDLKGDNKKLANAVNQIGESVNNAVNTSMKDEKMKADLITNVSHDLKTPLTSIINYVDLLKKEKIENENAKLYIAILDEKSQRLKQLTDDLVEASKISSGNIVLQMEKINVKQLLSQASAEFVDKFEEKNLSFVGTAPEKEIFITADSRRIYRVIDNLFTNIYKYAMEGTRIYLDIINQDKKVYISVKNISSTPLNVSAEELMERFVRGDEARNSEGSGLGLSIAKNLTEAMGGSFDIYLDGDLFKVILAFDEA